MAEKITKPTSWIRTWAGLFIPKRLTPDELVDKNGKPLFPERRKPAPKIKQQ